MVFTTEEIYSLVNNENESIHENNFVKIPINWKNDKLNEKWSNLFKIKQETNIAIEEKRISKEIGSSLEAEIQLSINKEKFELLDDIDLAEYFIVSKAEKKLGWKREYDTLDKLIADMFIEEVFCHQSS